MPLVVVATKVTMLGSRLALSTSLMMSTTTSLVVQVIVPTTFKARGDATKRRYEEARGEAAKKHYEEARGEAAKE